MKLKINQIKSIKESLSQLDGYEKVIDIDGKQKVVFQPYNLSGKFRWNIVKNLRILSPHLADFDKARDDLIRQISGGGTVIKKDETEKINEFVKQVSEMMQEEKEVDGLLGITQADLKLDADNDDNQIPSIVINGLYPLLS